MGLLNFIKEKLNPQILQRFDYLYSHYKAGVETFVSTHNNARIPGYNYTPKRIILSRNMSYNDKKTIVEAESQIIEFDRLHHQAVEAERKRKAVIAAAKSYKYGFYVLCKKYLSEYHITNAPTMPGHRKSQYAKRQEQERKKSSINAVCNITPFFADISLTSMGMGSSSKVIDFANFSNSEWIAHITNTLYPHLTEFQKEDEKIVYQLEIENFNCEFEDNVLDNTIRAKFYSAFIKQKYHISDDNLAKRKYVLAHLAELDSFADKELSVSCAELESSCPNGYKVFIQKYPKLSKYEILNRQEEILEFEINFESASRCENWEQEQSEYNSFCRNVADEVIPNYGNYGYDVTTKKVDYFGKSVSTKIFVRQAFSRSYCEETDLDYLGETSYLESAKHIVGFNNNTRYFYDRVYDKAFEFISKLHARYKDLHVFFCASAINGNKENFFNFHFSHLTLLLKEAKISFSFDHKIFPAEHRHVVVVEISTTNHALIDNCQKIISSNEDAYPVITYLSLYKRFDKTEMVEILKRKKQKIDAEKKKIEDEQRLQNERKLLIQRLHNATDNWNLPTYGSFKYFSLFYYYPTTCEWNASEDEWEVRNLIWDFKANPRRPTSESEIMSTHRKAISQIIPKLCKAIRHFFGGDVCNLTLVCIPSSSDLVTQRRYKDFSEIICRELGMTNAYSYINVTKNGEAKHLGGTNRAEVSLDKDFFKDKLVLLFDDVITSGKSMARFASTLEQLGATVIGGMSIGKTKHERLWDNPIDSI